MSQTQRLKLSSRAFGSPIKLDNWLCENPTSTAANPHHIPRMGAHGMISQFINMKKNYNQKLKEMVGSDQHACRYYCTDDCAYIFSLDVLESLVYSIKEGIKEKEAQDGCVILFQGLRKQSTTDEIASNERSFGRPTIIATAYVQDVNDDLTFVHIKLPNGKTFDDKEETYDGYEHPGDGNTGIQFSNKAPKSDLTSAVVEPTPSEYYDTDYRIKKTIKSDDQGKIGNWR